MQCTPAGHRVTARGAWSGWDGAGQGRTAPLGPGSGVSVSRKEMCRDQGKILRGSFKIPVLFLPVTALGLPAAFQIPAMCRCCVQEGKNILCLPRAPVPWKVPEAEESRGECSWNGLPAVTALKALEKSPASSA